MRRCETCGWGIVNKTTEKLMCRLNPIAYVENDHWCSHWVSSPGGREPLPVKPLNTGTVEWAIDRVVKDGVMVSNKYNQRIRWPQDGFNFIIITNPNQQIFLPKTGWSVVSEKDTYSIGRTKIKIVDCTEKDGDLGCLDKIGQEF